MEIDVRLIQESTFVPTYDARSALADPFIYFYHFGKTGGTTVNAYLQMLSVVHNDQAWLLDPNVDLDKLSSKLNEQSPWIAYGHSPYGTHSVFSRDTSLIALIRDPIEMTISNYFWENRYADESYLSGRGNFENFLLTHKSNYMMQKILEDVSEERQTASQAIDRLNQFTYVSISENIRDLLTLLGSKNGAPSSWVQNGKVNPNRNLKLELIEEFSDDIRDKNLCDHQIYEFAKKRTDDLKREVSTLASNPMSDTMYVVMQLANESTGVASSRPNIPGGKSVLIMDIQSGELYGSFAEYNDVYASGLVSAGRFDEASKQHVLSALPKS